mgnify:CR=1 FL=1
MKPVPEQNDPSKEVIERNSIMNTVKVRNIEIGAGIPKICVPIVGVTREEILAAAETIKSTKADVVEWRVDWYEDIFDFAKTEETMKALREVLGETPILFTFRTSKEGGEIPRPLSKDEILHIVKKYGEAAKRAQKLM